MWLTDLAKVARRTGYPVKEIAGWKRRGRAPMRGVRSIICHHTAGGSRGNAPSLGVVKNGRPGIPGPLAQIVLGRDGTIYIVAAGRSNHAGRVSATRYTNSYAIGIEAENTGREKWPARQMDAYAKLCRALADHYKVPISQVRGHKEVARPKGRKPDPSFSMNAFREMVRKRKGAPATGGKSQPKPAPKPAPKKRPAAPKRTGRVPGPGHAFPLPTRYYFGPKSGGNRSVSGFYRRKFRGKTDRYWLQEFGRQLARRGWSIGKGKTWLGRAGNDGKYGPEYAALIRRFQQDQGLREDSLLGEKTWDAAFKNSVT